MLKIFLILILLSVSKATEYNDQLNSAQQLILQQFEEKNDIKALFKVWHFVFNRHEEYSLSDSKSKKYYLTFKNNVKLIKEHNNSESTYKLGLNQYSDKTVEELMEYFKISPNGISPKEFRRLISYNLDEYDDSDDNDNPPRNNDPDPPSNNPINYTSYYTQVRNQGNCGSCWTFSSMGAIEGNYVKKLKESNISVSPRNLSTQQLVDCNSEQSPYGGCSGGWMTIAITHLTKYGIMWDSDYPYTASKGTCKFNASKLSPVKVNGYEKIIAGGSYSVLTRGPIAGCVNVQSSFYAYKSGLYNPVCNSTCHHAIVIVGYGKDPVLGNYWLGRNSWGSTWGESGYFRVKDNPANANSCLLADYRFNVRPIIK